MRTASGDPPLRTAPRSASEILEWFSRGGPTLVALSGGVDSAVVAALGQRSMPGRIRAATLIGPAVAEAEVDRARTAAGEIGIPLDLVPVDPLAIEGYRSNPSNRCYFCRQTEASALRRFGAALGIVRYVDGVHRDDLSDDRPGLRALEEAEFEHPLLWAGWGKAETRAEARSLGLGHWDAPADSCLASRIPHGQRIDRETLERIERAEAFVRSLGFVRVRVRADGPTARIEIDPEELPRLAGGTLRSRLEEHLRRLGFGSVEVDPRGYRRRANS